MRLVPVAIVACLLAPAVAHASAEADIRASFERYKKSVTDRNGEAAAAELDDNTIAWYARMRTAALSAPDIHGLPILEKLMVVRLRHELSPDQLAAMDGRSLLAYAIGKGWVSNAQVAHGGLGTIKVEGTSAKAIALYEGKPTSGQLIFHKGKTGWKIDLVAMINASSPDGAALSKKTGLSEDELVLKMVTEVTGRPVPATVWQPLTPNVRKR